MTLSAAPTGTPFILRCAGVAGVTFDNCIETDFGTTSYTYRCKKGLWSVTSTDQHYARGQALHYWIQYLIDGAYGDVEAIAEYGPSAR
jgi:hypothetical protein